MSRYPLRRLCDVGVRLYDCEHKTPKPASSGHPYIAIPDLRDGRIDLSNVRRITRRDYDKWTRRAKPQPGDIIVTRRGRVGDTAVVPDGLECAIGQNLVLLRSENSVVSQAYLRWALRGPMYREQVEKYLNVGAVFDSLNVRHIPLLEIPIPPLDTQDAIAALLGALDDKIELNRRMNETLRALIRLLFGQLLRGSTSEASVADLAQYVNGRNFTRDASGDGRMVIRIAELNSGPGTSTVFSDAEAPDEHVARFGDILFAWSGSLGVYRWYADDALINQHIFKVVPNGYPVWFVHQHLLRALPFFRDTAANKATTMGHIKRSHLSEARVEIPSDAALAAASGLIEPLDDRIAANERESRTLATLRDALLPKLLSGELRIRDAERTVEQAT